MIRSSNAPTTSSNMLSSAVFACLSFTTKSSSPSTSSIWTEALLDLASTATAGGFCLLSVAIAVFGLLLGGKGCFGGGTALGFIDFPDSPDNMINKKGQEKEGKNSASYRSVEFLKITYQNPFICRKSPCFTLTKTKFALLLALQTWNLLVY